jgi:hypothetical protein
VSNLALLTIGDLLSLWIKWKVINEEMVTRQGFGLVMVGVTSSVMRPRRHYWITSVSYSCRLRTLHCIGWLSSHISRYPKHILADGS